MSYLEALKDELERATAGGKPPERIAAIKAELARVQGHVEAAEGDAVETAEATTKRASASRRKAE